MVSSFSSIFCGLYRKDRQREGEGLQGKGSKYWPFWLKGEGDSFETEIKSKVAIFIIVDQSIHPPGSHPLPITSITPREAAGCCLEQPLF
jgi:hypothetical protein